VASVVSHEGSIDALRRVLSYLVKERQNLRSHEAPRPELEANRRAIVAMQMQLARALGQHYGPERAEREAATFRPSEGSREAILGSGNGSDDP
jgi:hypothetical protein